MSDAAREAEWIAEHAAIVPLPSEAIVRVRGEDALPWLNGQVTNDVRSLPTGASVYALLLDARGKIATEVRALREPGADEVTLLLPEAGAPALLAHAEKYVIMEDVEVARDDGLRVVHVAGPRARAVVERAGLSGAAYATDRVGSGGADVLVRAAELDDAARRLGDAARAEGGGTVSAEGLLLARLRAGLPAFGPDFGPRTYPQEAGLKERAVSFQKGCYLGQEVVVTLEHRGQLVRKLVRLVTPVAVDAGTRLRAQDGAEVGETTSCAVDPAAGHAWALGYVKRAAAVVDRRLQAGDVEARIDRVIGG
jgi:folate-binding protein YgfZ